MVAQNYFRVLMLGSIATDQWQSGCAFEPDDFGTPSVPIPSAAATAVADLARAFWVSAAPYTSAMVTFTGVRINAYGSGGALIGTVDATPTSGSISGSASANHPPQCCVVATLQSTTPGGSGRGRMYLPIVSPTVNTSTGAFPSADATALLGYLKTYINGVAALTSLEAATCHPVVASTLPGGSLIEVTSLRMGNVFDTQRRRRDKVVETYSSVTL